MGRKNAVLLYGLVSVIQFILFKWRYPSASLMPDSGFYIEAARNNDVISFWPIGYSQFLRFFKFFIQSDMALVLFQYLLLQAAILGFICTLFHFLQPGRLVRWIILAFFALNPLWLITSNYIAADALFIALSFIWVMQLIWLLYRPAPWLVVIHALVLLLVFTVRYNALYYPLISIVVLLVSRLRLSIRLAGTGLIAGVIFIFIWHNTDQYKAITGERQFTAFGGWQLAANALYAYSRVDEKREAVPTEFNVLHQVVQHHLDSLRREAKRPDSIPGPYYLWKGPLKQYLAYRYGDTSITDFNHYAALAPLYAAYGKYLIKQYPTAYAKYFLWPNLVRYYVPNAEFLSRYNIKTDPSKEYTGIGYMPVLSAIINLLFIGSLLCFILTGEWKRARPLTPFLLLVTALWIANMGFSVLASPIVLRYQLFTLSMIGCAGIIMCARIYNSDKIMQDDKKNNS